MRDAVLLFRIFCPKVRSRLVIITTTLLTSSITCHPCPMICDLLLDMRSCAENYLWVVRSLFPRQLSKREYVEYTLGKFAGRKWSKKHGIIWFALGRVNLWLQALPSTYLPIITHRATEPVYGLRENLVMLLLLFTQKTPWSFHAKSVSYDEHCLTVSSLHCLADVEIIPQNS